MEEHARPGRRLAPAVAVATLAAMLGACAGAPPAPPPAVGEAAPPDAAAGPEALEAAEGGYPLPEVSGEPAIAPLSRRLEAATDAERPALLLARAAAALRTALDFRDRRMEVWNILAIEDELRFVAYHELARRDCEELLERFPGAPQAAEAQYTLGLIDDYPHLTRFADAEAAYRLTISRYPGTDAARRARDRLEHLQELLGSRPPGGGGGSPYHFSVPPAAP